MSFLLPIVLILQIILMIWLFRKQNRERNPEWLESLTRLNHDLDAMKESFSVEREKILNGQHQEFREMRAELGQQLERLQRQSGEQLQQQFQTFGQQQKNLFDAFSNQLSQLTTMNEQKLERVRDIVEKQLHKIQEDNALQLEKMRQTVDEKLNATLEQRLTESFKLVSERLEAVHKGLGEMQTLASNVGDLKRVLGNVKTRGTFGEIQLEMLLEQILSPEQYEKNVSVRKGSADRVEFAIKLPGRDRQDEAVWLPIDCKFPLEDYQRMLDAEDRGDLEFMQETAKSLLSRIRQEAKSISDKYLDPPHTTDFAILYLPIEGLFAEVLRQPGMLEKLQQEFRVIVSGPTTITALLNSLQMGFRTLAIQKRSSEVWELLGAIKTQFGTFGDLLQKTQKKLQEASNVIERASRSSRGIERKLRQVEALPNSQASLLLPELGTEEEWEELDQ
ncbi:DNA recombination protein RmuC [Alicyclobacillus tolerans]|uniref:DNA recombination protein RmuC n=1 Tax=Alicyclobacillus tolerans TaxID=90970 RepID=A0ABT9LXX7_9BACL|nr:DNA recombination protein RmuC [Alicyclobacillus tengchongensis]MDP9729119.1 DNA recombination protein RmuC [Alicyclobacillus tengchongensis]